MNEQGTFGKTIHILSSLDFAPQPNPLRRNSARRAFLEHAAVVRAERAYSARVRGNNLSRFLRLTTAGIAALVLALGGLTGAAYAADDALPGDFLYSLDRAAERVALLLAQTPADVVELQLAISEERLLESEQLAAAGDQVNMAVALREYGSAVSALAKTVAEGRGQQDSVGEMVSETLSTQEQRLLMIREHVPPQAFQQLDLAIEAAHEAQTPASPVAPGRNDGVPGQKPSPSDSKHDSKDRQDKPHSGPK